MQVRAISGGAGVDVVLNSLSGDAMEQSLSVLKPFGRFLELGKRDFYLNRRIHLRPLRQNISYFAIDVDQLPVQRPDLARALLSEVSTALSEGAIRPLAHRTFGFAAIGEAFRLMQASGHIGKLVLVPQANAGVRLRQAPEMILRRDGTYLVTGGISGFGFAAASWLARHGAGSIALLGRGAPRRRERPTERTNCARLVPRFGFMRATSPIPPRSPRFSTKFAGSSHRCAVSSMRRPPSGTRWCPSSTDRISPESCRPKLGGAIALDRLTSDDPIELFLLFSSATTLLGAPGQGVYVAANLALEAMARHRRAARQAGPRDRLGTDRGYRLPRRTAGNA